MKSALKELNKLTQLFVAVVVVMAGTQTAFAQPVVLDSINSVSTNCGSSTGVITIFSSFGVGPVSYSVNGGASFQTTNTFTNLSSGQYQVVVQDSAGFSANTTIIIAGAASLITTVNSTDPLCNGQLNGQIDIVATGVAPVLYSIDGGLSYLSTSVFTGLSAGNYTVVALDGDFCTDTSLVVLTEPGALSATSLITNASCPAADGSVTVNATGGIAPVQYSIDNGVTFQFGNVFTGLASGQYSILISDANGCSYSSPVVVNSAPGTGPSLLTLNHINPLCNGSANGSISALAIGVQPIEYSIDNGITFSGSGVFTGLTPGTYGLIAQDANGCVVGGVVNISEPAVLVSVVTVLNETCVGNDGIISINTQGGTSPYQYSFNGGSTFGSNNQLTSIAGGTYNMEVFDANGCSEVQQVVLTSGGGPTIVSSIASNASCPGIPDGGFVVDAISQSSSIIYSIDGGVVWGPSGAFTALVPGNYTVLVEDANGCQTSVTAIINGPVTPFADFTVSATNGITPLTVDFLNNSVGATSFEWQFGNGDLSTDTNPTYIYTNGGAYTVILLATDGVCTDSATIVITAISENGITVPNIFTPNGDGVNDFFYANPVGIISLRGVIYNRYGAIVYMWDGPEGGWDGHTAPAGVPCSDGVYYYVIDAVDRDGNQISQKGTVQLVRTANKREN